MTIRAFGHNLSSPLALLAGLETAFAFVAFYLAILVRFDESLSTVEHTVGTLWPKGLIFAMMVFVSMAATGLYSARQRARFFGIVTRTVLAILFAVVAVAGIFYFVPDVYIGRGVVSIAATITLGASLFVRAIMNYSSGNSVFKRRVLVLGCGVRAHTLAMLRRRVDRRGFNLLGYVADYDDRPPEEGIAPVFQGQQLSVICERLGVEEIVVALDNSRSRLPINELLKCRLDGILVTELVAFLERETGKLRLDVLNPSWMVFSDGFNRNRLQQLVERTIDVTVSLVLLALTWPLMLLVLLAIKLEDGWNSPIIFRQIRVGQYGKPFQLYKLRSMRVDAEGDGQARYAQLNDARVTRVGSFIRKTRLDEIPQLFNVLAGDMSLVGPRPERPEFVSELQNRIPYYAERHAIKPGLTGWAQLCYSYGSSERDALEKLQYDLYYVKNHSLGFYLSTILQTVEVILWRKGAR